MGSSKEEERNEKIIRGLLKLPPNRRCINCNSLGPQYVCTSFWTFVCVTCSGIHREFTHRVKSVSMAKFTTQEVEALQRGGNQQARETFFKDWDSKQARLPDSSCVDKVREFIKTVYVDKRYAGGRVSEKPPRDVQTHKHREEEFRRASSYHSYSQSPPYDYQYEERRYGKQTGVLSRRPGSDGGHYEGKTSSFICSPGLEREQIVDDRFANESCGSRFSDYSGSSIGDPFRFDGQSPNFLANGHASPPIQGANGKRELKGAPRSQRTASSGSVGSFDSASLNTVTSDGLIDAIIEPEHDIGNKQNENSEPPIDFFANFDHQHNPATSKEKANVVPLSENVGWATFDLPPKAATSKVYGLPSLTLPSSEEATEESTNFFAPTANHLPWFPASDTCAPLTEKSNACSHEVNGFGSTNGSERWSTFDDASNGTPILSGMLPRTDFCSQDAKISVDTNSSQSWCSFDDINGNSPQNLSANLFETRELQYVVNKPPRTTNPFDSESYEEGSLQEQKSVNPFDLPQEGSHQEQKSVNPFDLPFDSDAEALDMFMDMSSLKETLPPSVSGSSETWFPLTSAAPFPPSVPQGSLPYLAGHAPNSQLQNLSSQSTVTPLSANPFA